MSASVLLTSQARRGSPEIFSSIDGMALINELFAGVLSGGDTCRPETEHENDVILNAMLSIIIDPEKLTDRASFEQEIDATLAHVKASPAADPSTEPRLRETRAPRSRA